MIPQSPSDLTPARLTLILRDAGYLPTGEVRQIHMTDASDTSGIVGHTVRLQVEYDVPTDAPTALIAKFPTTNAGRRHYFSELGMYSREVLFYQEIAASVPLNLPRCYYTVHDETTQHAFLLLEDLSPVVVGDRVAGCSIESAELALMNIARLHTSWWNSPKLSQWDWLHSYNQAAFEMQFHRSWADFQTSFSSQISDEALRIGEVLSRNLSLLARLWQPPLTLIHRDYNLDNLLFQRDNDGSETLYIIDWQLVRQGRAVFDVATFLCWNLQPDVRRRAAMQLLESYYGALTEAGIVDYSFKACVTDYHLAQLECLARIIAILGSGMVDEPHLIRLLHTILERNVAAISDWDLEALTALD